MHRRQFLSAAGMASVAGLFHSSCPLMAAEPELNRIIGEPTGEKAGQQVFADGGNAFDAIVAAAFSAMIAVPYQTGVGGYGGSITLALAGGKKIISIDCNSAAPAAMLPDTFVKNPTAHQFGWLSAGVPGLLAGLQLLIDNYGTRKLSDLLPAAIRLAEEGVPITAVAARIQAVAGQFAKDPGSKKLYLDDAGKVRQTNGRFRNPDLAQLLKTLAQRNSVESFYRGDIAQLIADGFKKQGGLVTAADMAAYQAKEVAPLKVDFGPFTAYTAPVTAGGITTLQIMHALQAMKWHEMPAGLARNHAYLEASRLAWRDRLSLLGDTNFVQIPVGRLLSAEYATASAEQVMKVVKEGKLLNFSIPPREQNGTIHLSAADKQGNFVALTLTHGEGFGARVTVDGLGLTLGHGMSRFEIDPKHPNGPAPGKRPLMNMCPVVVTRNGEPVLAVGGRGGRKIPNTLCAMLSDFVLRNKPLAEAMNAPRLHTEGSPKISVENRWPAEDLPGLKGLGYEVTVVPGAVLSAVAKENGEHRTAIR